MLNMYIDDTHLGIFMDYCRTDLRGLIDEQGGRLSTDDALKVVLVSDTNTSAPVPMHFDPG